MAPERPTPDKSRNGSLVAGPAAVPAGGGVPWNGQELGGSFALGPWRVRRAGYGVMQLAGDGVFGPPRDRGEALRVLRAAVAAGVNHIDTAHYYGAGTVNELIREALHPYPGGLAIVSKVAARRDGDGGGAPVGAARGTSPGA